MRRLGEYWKDEAVVIDFLTSTSLGLDACTLYVVSRTEMSLGPYSFDPHSANKFPCQYQYEGRSICNENSPVYPKVLYLHAS